MTVAAGGGVLLTVWAGDWLQVHICSWFPSFALPLLSSRQ